MTMKRQRTAPTILATLLSLLLVSLAPISCLAEDGLAGWGIDSEYNSYYNAKELDKFKGKITKFVEITPLPGMAPGTGFYFDEGDGEAILVHLCPAAFASAKKTGLRKNIKTKLRGSWAVIDGKDVFLASKVKQGEHFSFKVRLTKDGTPFWTMSPEQLAREQASD
jgi:hypothetical protein